MFSDFCHFTKLWLTHLVLCFKGQCAAQQPLTKNCLSFDNLNRIWIWKLRCWPKGSIYIWAPLFVRIRAPRAEILAVKVQYIKTQNMLTKWEAPSPVIIYICLLDLEFELSLSRDVISEGWGWDCVLGFVKVMQAKKFEIFANQ